MSFIGNKPFVDTCLDALSSDEQISLLSTINNPNAQVSGYYKIYHAEDGFVQLQNQFPDYHKFYYVSLSFDWIMSSFHEGFLIRLGENDYGFLGFEKNNQNMIIASLRQLPGKNGEYNVLQEQLTTEEFRRVLNDLNDTPTALADKVTVHNLPDGDWTDEVLPSEIIDTFKAGDVLISPGKYGIVVFNKNNYCRIYEINSAYIQTYNYHKINGEWTYDGGGDESFARPIDSDTNALGGIIFYGGDEYIIPNAGKELRFRMEFRNFDITIHSESTQDWFEVSSFIIYSSLPFSNTGAFLNRVADVFLNNPASTFYVPVLHTALVNGERQVIDNDLYRIGAAQEGEYRFLNLQNLRTGQVFETGYPEDGDLVDGLLILQVDLEDGGYDLYEL